MNKGFSMTRAALTIHAEALSLPTEAHQAALGWAVLHRPTREAFRRSTGEDISPALDRYLEWVEENVVGKPEGFGRARPVNRAVISVTQD